MKGNGTTGRNTKIIGAKPRLFRMIRNKDGKSISGTGHVIDGVLFEDGRVVINWRSQHRSIAIFDSLADFYAIHVKEQYTGENDFVWVEGYKPSEDVAEACDTIEHLVLSFDEMRQKHKGAIIALLKGIKRKYRESGIE